MNNDAKFSWQRKSMKEILLSEYPPIKWAVPGVIPDGLTIVIGAPKDGKSLFALHLGTAASHGGYFMGSIKVEQREVLYLALEDNERRIKDRALKQGGLANDKLFIETPRSWNGGIENLRKYLKEFPDTGLVMIDTMFKFSPIEDTNDYGKTYKAISTLQDIAIKQSIPIVLIHHTRKGSAEGEWADAGMGSRGINSAADTIILLKRNGKGAGTMTVKGRDVEEKAYSLSFNSEMCTWCITGESELGMGDSRAQTEVLDILSTRGAEGMQTGHIAKALGKTSNTVLAALNQLMKKGKASNIKHGIWAANSNIQFP